MKIYVVTSGCYSDYHIDQVFTSRKMASAYANLDPDRRVETYVADSVDMIQEMQKAKGLMVVYDFQNNVIDTYGMCDIEGEPDRVDDYFSRFLFRFELPLSVRLVDDIVDRGIKSPLLLKIAQDRFAEYCYAHDTSKEKIIREKEAEKERWMMEHTPFCFRTTSSANLINEGINQILRQKIHDGKVLPDGGQLTKMIFDAKNKGSGCE